ncbi:MAG: molybdate ABC transporter substrate-binding protein [Pseudonocardiaceae bacterium]|nr:molybdate ABC transporter substrate-binding protein [Pseudonocardiaceae bacterium]
MPHYRSLARRLAGLSAVLGLAVAGCAGDPESASSEHSGGRTGASGQVTVFAAASLTEAFTEIGKAFEQANPDADLRFNFAGSATLSQQLTRGAPADVFASANTAQMQQAVGAGVTAGEPTVFVTNTLQIVVPAGNPANVTGLADFGKKDLALAVCAAQVPCGAVSQTLFETAGITPAPDTLEQSVKAVLTKVRLGEADAGLVYRTDVASAEGPVEGIDFPGAEKETNEYPIAALEDAPNAAGAHAFIDYVRSDEGKAALEEFGFGTDVS